MMKHTPMTRSIAEDNQSEHLPDIQGLPDERGVALQHVGIRQVALPLKIVQKDGKVQNVQGKASLAVSLGQETKGTHMSRMISILTQWGREHEFNLDLEALLHDAKSRLSAPSAEVELDFDYFIDKPAPASKISAPMAYHCQFKGVLDVDDQYHLIVTLIVPVTTLCPCSKAISKYGAHNQRATLTCRMILDTSLEDRVLWIEDLIDELEACSSCPVYPMLKRVDEKYVTERAYENPMFVEDVIREVTLLLKDKVGVKGFDLHLEALESIHDHNAWAANRYHFDLK